MKFTKMSTAGLLIVIALVACGIMASRKQEPPRFTTVAVSRYEEPKEFDFSTDDNIVPDESELVCVLETGLVNVGVLEFHFNQPLIEKRSVYIPSSKRDTPEQSGVLQVRLARRVEDVKGIIKVTISDQYELKIEKARAFDWQEVIPKVLRVISEEMNAGKPVVIKSMPDRLSERRNQRQAFR